MLVDILLDIQAAVWVRLCPDGTDVTAAENGDHEWEDDDRALCAARGHEGTVKFAISGWPGLQAG